MSLAGIFKALVAAATRFARSERKASVAPAPAPAGGGFPVAAYEAALDRLVEVAHAAGTAEERARIASIMNLPEARGFAAFAWGLAESGVLTREQAKGAIIAVMADTQPSPVLTNEPAPEGAILH